MFALTFVWVLKNYTGCDSIRKTLKIHPLQDTFFYTNRSVNCRGRLLDLTNPVVMGILNVTPDSFFDGGKFMEEEAIVKQVGQMLSAGAAIIDVGAASTRPGAGEIPVKDELSRLLPVLEMLTKEFPSAIFSVDTYHSDVAMKAVEKGAHLVNDISGGSMDENMFAVVGEMQVPYVLMHIKGTPADMQFDPVYENVTIEITDYFIRKLEKLHSFHVNDIILDPGFGFGKTVDHNFILLNHLNDFKIFGLPVMAGISRKSIVCRTLGVKPADALNGSTVLHVLALQQGAKILRVHDVKEAVEAIRLLSVAQKAG